MAERTLPALFQESVRRFPRNPLVWEKRDGTWRATTYAEMDDRVRRIAAGLRALGLRAGDRVALVSEGRADWVAAELAIFSIGAVDVPISVKIAEREDFAFRLRHSGCRAAVVSRGQAEKVRRVRPDLPDLQTVVVLDREAAFPDETSLDDVMGVGARRLAEHPGELERGRDAVRESDAATISYTSGTTADPKGIVLTHRNYTANVDQGLALVPCREDYVTLLILPWDHAFAHSCGIYMMMKTGASFAAVDPGRSGLETLKNIPDNIKEIRPHFLLSAPALAKNFRKGIERGIREKGPRVEALFARALKTACRYYGNGWDRGRGMRKRLKPLVALYDRLLFRKVRENFGGRLEFFVGGAALLDPDLQRFFYALGIPMLQGYGLTEAAPVISANSMAAHKLGTSGRVAPGIEIRICGPAGEDLPAGRTGEIVVKGENVMAGYWLNERATREVLRDGWLSTGDVGSLDEDGFLSVQGRVKSLLIGNDGEKFSPETIEEAVVERSPLVEQLMLHNSQSPWTVGLLVPNREALNRRLEEDGLSCATDEGRRRALRLLEAEIDAYREGGRFAGMFPARWLPAAVAVLDQAFTEQNGLLNSTMKVVRGRVLEAHADRVEALFTAEGRDILHPANLEAIGRLAG